MDRYLFTLLHFKLHLTVEDMLADIWDFWMSVHVIPICRVKM